MYAEIFINQRLGTLSNKWTYEVPDSLQIKKGDGVLVPFQRGQKAGLVLRLHKETPDFKVRHIAGLLEDEELMKAWQFELADWISEYYFCSKYEALRLMLPKNIFRIPKRKSKTLTPRYTQKEQVMHTLTFEQEAIVKTIQKEKTKISLIHGVTGSGKTEIYRHLIKKVVLSGQQALVLVPEIGLTPQFKKYFEQSFPSLAVIHSKVPDGKKAELWRAIRRGEIQVVLGSRSALFAPFNNLGLIVMDEEHEWSYKQDQSPRYHARSVALKLTELTGAQLVLGSATPSMESMNAAHIGNYKLFTLSKRVENTPLPSIQIIDMREELKSGNFSIFSEQLEQKISSTLANGNQALLFLNRRGSASSTLCRDCGHVNTCPHCELPLTYHARNFRVQSLVCHHCGFLSPLITTCPNCKSTRIKHLGLGTERVESELQKRFPSARIARADKDTMSRKNSFSELHEKLNNEEIDILLGTQMIGKGWDLPKVSLVGVVMADLGLHIPDFRTTERMFQLLTQVAGRAGRRKTQGEVLIQTYNPEHPSLRFTQIHDSLGFFEQEMSSRRGFGLPPFGQIIKLMFVHEKQEIAKKRAEDLREKLAELAPPGLEIFTAPALLPQVRKKAQWNVLIQGQDLQSLLKSLDPEHLKDCRIDVDPLVSI